jgi:hypothetical protein
MVLNFWGNLVFIKANTILYESGKLHHFLTPHSPQSLNHPATISTNIVNSVSLFKLPYSSLTLLDNL